MNKTLLTCMLIISSIHWLSAGDISSPSTLTLLPNENSFVIDLNSFDGGVNYITITDKSGKTVFTNDIDSKKERIKYVLDYLPADTYTVKIKGDQQVEYYTINILKDSAHIVDVKTYSSPTVKSIAHRVIVESNNNNQDDINLTILNKLGDVVYSYSEKLEGSYKKAFNLRNLGHGNYKVLVSDDQFRQEVSVAF